jgi:Protein of unknown function (DUF1501)
MNSFVNKLTRRDWLQHSSCALGGIALASMLQQDSQAGEAASISHHFPRARRVVQLFMSGAASHVDTFDYKPALIKQNGKKWDPGEQIELFQDGLGATMQSPWGWKQYGESGKWLNEIVAPLGACVDEMAFVHNVVGKTGVHSQATLLQSTGFQVPGFPGAGTWVSYALGSLNENLPTFVVLPDHRGFPPNGPQNWGAGFLPAQFQGTMIRPGALNPIADLFPTGRWLGKQKADGDALALMESLNRQHQESRVGDSRLEARIQSYELAAKMQLAAPAALDLSQEPAYIMKKYGLDRERAEWPAEINVDEEIVHFGRKCLVARRLLEQGVRYVQIWSGCDNGFPRRNWDSHEDVERDHGPLALGMANGAAALISDLKERGMLDDTLVIWNTEFGRMPCSQGSKGRDHNPFVFSTWMCGGGIKPGTTFGESDEWGFKPADRNHPTQCYDIYATMLHLLGLDHEKLTFRHNGIDRRLTDVHGRVIQELIA